MLGGSTGFSFQNFHHRNVSAACNFEQGSSDSQFQYFMRLMILLHDDKVRMVSIFYLLVTVSQEVKRLELT